MASQPDGGFESFTLSKNPNRHGIGITRQDPYFEVGAFMDLARVSQNKILNISWTYLEHQFTYGCSVHDTRSDKLCFPFPLPFVSSPKDLEELCFSALGESFQGHRKGAPFESFKLPVRIECQLRNYFSCLRMASIGSIFVARNFFGHRRNGSKGY